MSKWITLNTHVSPNRKRPYLFINLLTHLFRVDYAISALFTGPFLIEGGDWNVFIITIFYGNSCIKYKQCRPWSDGAFCGVWSRSTLFAIVCLFLKDSRNYEEWVNGQERRLLDYSVFKKSFLHGALIRRSKFAIFVRFNVNRKGGNDQESIQLPNTSGHQRERRMHLKQWQHNQNTTSRKSKGQFLSIMKTRLFKYTENFTAKKNESFQINKIWYFSYFCSKHTLWVLVRTASTRRF